MDILTVQNLQKRFGDKEVLKGLHLSVPEHSIFGFVGKNGAGKTTTMKAILGFLKVDDGDIFVAGEKVVYGQTPTNRLVGYLPDVPEFYSFMTAKEYLKLCGESMHMNPKDTDQRSDQLLSLVGLLEEKHRIKGYSRGMKQRLGIAQALLGRPKLLICDEPTSALDPVGRKEILDILSSVKEETTVLFSTHILSDVERICTQVALLNDGKIAMQGSMEELKKLHQNQCFTVEMTQESDTLLLKEKYPNCTLGENNILSFSDGDERLFEIMNFIGENRLSVRKIEKNQASLESLFVEVVKK